jgi:Permeases of the drug/metabolite transporter (DMT) superfamily
MIMLKDRKAVVYAGVLVAMVFWSFSFIWYKDVYLYLLPFTTIFLRLAISSVLLFLFSWSFKKLEKVKPSDYKFILLLAFFEPFLYFIGESLGMQIMTPTSAAVIISVIPLLVPVLAFLMLHEKLSVKNILGIFISFLGVMLVIANKDFEFRASMTGVLLMSLAVVGAVFYSVLLKKLTASYNPFTLITWQNTVGTIMFLPLVLVYDVKSWTPAMFKIKAAVPLLELAVFASSVAFLLYTNGVRKIGAVRANIFTNLIPVMTAFLSFLLLNEKLFFHNIIGIAVVIGGLILSQLDSISSYKKKIFNN